jgi:hypothetical protein
MGSFHYRTFPLIGDCPTNPNIFTILVKLNSMGIYASISRLGALISIHSIKLVIKTAKELKIASTDLRHSNDVIIKKNITPNCCYGGLVYITVLFGSPLFKSSIT